MNPGADWRSPPSESGSDMRSPPSESGSDMRSPPVNSEATGELRQSLPDLQAESAK